jgi:hypothetical protein
MILHQYSQDKANLLIFGPMENLLGRFFTPHRQPEIETEREMRVLKVSTMFGEMSHQPP